MYSLSQRLVVLNQLEFGKTLLGPVARNYSANALAKRFGMSAATISRWAKSENTEEAMAERLSSRGRKRKLSEEQEAEVMAWAEGRLNNYQTITGEELRKHVLEEHQLDVSRDLVSRMMRRNGWSSQATQKRPAQRCRETYDEEVRQFREQWGSADCSNYVVLDECGVWNDHVVPRSYAPRGRTPSIGTDSSSVRDTLVAFLRGDGTKIEPYYIKHKKQKSRNRVITERAIKGMTEAIFLDVIETRLRPNCPPGTFIFMDLLSSHYTQRVRERLNAYQLIPVYFPAKTAADLSPCDNFFFHLFKLKFRKLDRSTPEKKREAAYQAYNDVSEENVRACFRKCGLLLDQVEVVDDGNEAHQDHEEEEGNELDDWMMIV